MQEVFDEYFDAVGSPCDLHVGDRLRLTVDALVSVQIAFRAPSSDGATATLPAGTLFEVEMEPAPTAVAVPCRPVDYAEVEEQIVDDRTRRDPKYGGYGVLLMKRDIGRVVLPI